MVKYYRLSNIVNGGKKPPCSTSWDLVPKLYPNSLGHKYVNYYKNVTSRYGWRSNIDTLNLIINEKLEEKIKEDPLYLEKIPKEDEIIFHLRLGDVIDKDNYWKEPDYFDINYNDIIIKNVKKTHVKPIQYYETIIEKMKKHNLKKIIIVTNYYHGNMDNFNDINEIDVSKINVEKSKKYLNCIIDLFEKNDYEVKVRMPNNIKEILDYNYIDNDFIYISNSKYAITSDTGVKCDTSFSKLLSKIIKKRGGVLLN